MKNELKIYKLTFLSSLDLKMIIFRMVNTAFTWLVRTTNYETAWPNVFWFFFFKWSVVWPAFAIISLYFFLSLTLCINSVWSSLLYRGFLFRPSSWYVQRILLTFTSDFTITFFWSSLITCAIFVLSFYLSVVLICYVVIISGLKQNACWSFFFFPSGEYSILSVDSPRMSLLYS